MPTSYCWFMKDRHKVPAITLRLDEEMRDWLVNYAKDTNQPMNAVVTQALLIIRYGQIQQKGESNV